MVRLGRALRVGGAPIFRPQAVPLTFLLYLLHSFANLGLKDFRLISGHRGPHWYHCGQSPWGLRYLPHHGRHAARDHPPAARGPHL